MPKTLWTIRENATLTAERFARFVEKAREAGVTPAALLQKFILDYVERLNHDATPENATPKE